MNFEYTETIKDVTFRYTIIQGVATLAVHKADLYEEKRLEPAQLLRATKSFTTEALKLSENVVAIYAGSMKDEAAELLNNGYVEIANEQLDKSGQRAFVKGIRLVTIKNNDQQ